MTASANDESPRGRITDRPSAPSPKRQSPSMRTRRSVVALLGAAGSGPLRSGRQGHAAADLFAAYVRGDVGVRDAIRVRDEREVVGLVHRGVRVAVEAQLHLLHAG